MSPGEADRNPAPPMDSSVHRSRPGTPSTSTGPWPNRVSLRCAELRNSGRDGFFSCMTRWWNLASRMLSLVGLAVLLAGCESYGRADWNTRVGKYSWDQALEELGPPESDAKTSDGSRVADWVISKSRTYSTAVRGPLFWSWGGQDVTTTAESHLLLTFAPDGKLRSWKRIYK